MNEVQVAAAARKDEVSEVREVLARATKFYQRYEKHEKEIVGYLADLRALKNDVVQLLNAQESESRLLQDARAMREKTEREAQVRLQSVEQGHRALIDKLSKKEIELDNLKAEVEKRERMADEARHKYELLAADCERKIGVVNEVAAKKK